MAVEGPGIPIDIGIKHNTELLKQKIDYAREGGVVAVAEHIQNFDPSIHNEVAHELLHQGLVTVLIKNIKNFPI